MFSSYKIKVNANSLTDFCSLNGFSDIVWANQLAYGVRDIPTSHKRERD